MQISSTSGGARGLGPVPRRNPSNPGPSSDGAKGAQATPAGPAQTTPETRGADAPARAAEGATPSERLDAVTQRFTDRLDHLLENENLSEEERAGLLEAKEAFDSLLGRLQGALEGDTVPSEKAVRAFQHALDKLRNDVHDTLGGGGDEGPQAAGRAGIYGSRGGTQPAGPTGSSSFEVTV